MSNDTSRPRVLHLIDTGGPGGAETVFSALATYGRAHDLNAAVAVPYDGWLMQRLRSEGVCPIVLASKNTSFARLTSRLSKLARECGANIIHAHLLGASVYGALIGLRHGLPVIAVFHGETDLRGPGSFLAAKRWLLNRAHVTPVAVSDSVRHALEQWGVLGHKIRVIRNGVDTVGFAPVGRGSLHASLGLAPSSRIIGAVGNIRPAKSYNVLVEAARHIVLARPDVHFVVAGSGSGRDVDELHRLVEKLGVGANFHFIGFCPSSSELYRSFAMLVSSAKTEGLPLSFLEAMACEVPIVATANEGAQDLVKETGAGVLSPVGDAKALSAAILRLLDDPAAAALLAKRGRVAVSKQFSLERSLAEYHELYRGVLSKRQP